MEQRDAVRSTVLALLQTFDEGIAPAMNEIVTSLLAEHPSWAAADIRRCVSALEEAGDVSSRWDGDAHVYWA